LALRGFRHWPVSDEKIGFDYKVKRFLEGSLMSAERAHVYWNGTFSDAEKREIVQKTLPGSLDHILGQMGGLSSEGDDLATYLWFDQKYYLPDDILTKVDRMSMAHAVEVRPPFLDHRIVEFAATLPTSFKIRGSRQKLILKELMKGKLPPAIRSRKKIGFDIPAHEWLRGPLRSLLLDTLHAGSAENSGIFHAGAIESCASRHLKRRANLGYHLWGLLMLFLWMKRWKIQTTASAAAEGCVPEGAGIFT
jgi:asparagine synthase (glutamine-hydrolysing)